MKHFLFLTLALSLVALSCQKEEISISENAADRFFLRSDNASMPVRVYGNTASKTFLIIVHGGPGGDDVVYRNDYVIQNLEPKFAVVYWDQRNSGASQGGANGDFNAVADFVSDFEKLIVLLKYRYGNDISLFANGHSWGGFLTPAFLTKGNNQFSLKGWIQTDGAHNIPLLNEAAIKKLSEKAAVEIQANRHVDDWKEIKAYCDGLSLPLSLEETLKLNRYAGQAEGLTEEISDPKYEAKDIVGQYQREHTPILPLFMSSLNPVIYSVIEEIFGEGGAELSSNLNTIAIPTLILFGAHDYICPPALADDVELRISSIYKRKVLFEHSGHSPMNGADEKAYWDEVIAFVQRFK